ncbi:predicted protein [Naegleria gruberi]|uniref:Predicted protein n=1 Tax=Naegleria gruberi TaxID=5762 RepID=D2VRX8_NAEGR|nr:uncharacterized protein NAEGRDRAFT_71742 [Naegleria gruberi]EFC40468.1 predicted protein [Naegleria gruberi]|eukprot:XP_002673212.1 predicted protein [Naegleria gruberi strain NEG-M]
MKASSSRLLVLCCGLLLILGHLIEAQKVKIDSTFGTKNMVVNDFVQYNFPIVIQQTQCALQVSFDYNINVGMNASRFAFTAETLSPNPFGTLHTPATTNLKIYGLYKITFEDFDPNTGSLDITVVLSNPSGFLNVNPFSMIFYKKADATLMGEFVDAESHAFSDSVMIATNYNNLLTQNLLVAGLYGDLAQSVQSRIDKSNTVPGPTTFLFDILPSMSQSLIIAFPNQKPAKTPPTFTLSEYNDFEPTAVPKGYVSLHSYQLSTSVDPPTFSGSTWSLSFDATVGFFLNDEKTPVEIQPSSLTCACTANSDEIYQKVESRVSTDKLTCKIEDPTTCVYPMIIARLAPKESVPVQVTDMTFGQTFREKVEYGNKKMFKVVVPSSVKFTISAKSLYQGETATLFVNSRGFPTETVNIARKSIDNKETTVTIENKEVGPLDYYISIAPVFAEGAVIILNVDYSSSLDDNAIIILSVTIPMFFLVLIVCMILVVVLCRKKKPVIESDPSMFHKLQDNQ